MLNVNLEELEMTNVYIIIANSNKSNYLNEFYCKASDMNRKLNYDGIELKKKLLKEFKMDFIFEGAISHYEDKENPTNSESNKSLLTRRLNTLVLTALNSKGIPLNKKEVVNRPEFKTLFSDLDEIYKMKLSEYLVKLLIAIPEMVVVHANTKIKSYMGEALNSQLEIIKLPDIEVFKRRKFTLSEALQITLTLDKNKLVGLLSEKEVKKLKEIGFIQGDIAVEVCFNQILYNENIPKDNPLGIFIHSLQHYYYHPLTDKEYFEEELLRILMEISNESLPILVKPEIEYIKESIMKIVKELK